jgi:hypothetical protein
MEVKVFGDAKVRAEIRRLAKRYPAGMAAALYRLGVAILSDALPRTPVEFAVLRSSGYVSPPKGTGTETTVEVGFGTVYAVAQHERMDYRHPRGGGPKYLERAAQSLAPRALDLLAKWASDARFRGGWGQASGVPTRPNVGNTNTKKRSQTNRLARAGRNVRRKTSR